MYIFLSQYKDSKSPKITLQTLIKSVHECISTAILHFGIAEHVNVWNFHTF